ncbi:radical SAM protein [bacterium]|nr:radical SAM protein [candidate division CSSED10-310 bacterium]
MRILLLNPMPRGSPVPTFPVLPLGIALIAAIARQGGAEVTVFSGPDLNRRISDYLVNNRPDLVGIQTFVNNLDTCFRLSGSIKSRCPETVIVYGGVQATNYPDRAFESPHLDCIVPGEGELIFHNLIETFGNGFQGVDGLIWRDSDGVVRRNPGHRIVENLDDLPQIPYSLFYGRNAVTTGHILTHRGCPFHCSYCPLRFRAGSTIRKHSPERVVSTIEYLRREFRIRHLEFFDENFTMHPDLVESICRAMEPMNLTWNCTARISQMNPELANIMARSGCREILFGIGSGVPRLQEVLGTFEDLDKAPALIEKIRKEGIRVILAFSLGIPGETKLEFNHSVKYALRLKADRVRFDPSAPLPGTRLHELAGQGGRFLISTWDEYLNPGQIIYLPAGRRPGEFKMHLYAAKLRARFQCHFMKRI